MHVNGRPFSRPVISTESRDGGMFSTAVTQSSPAFFTFLYSTRNDWMGKPRLPRGIQVTYADVSVAVETVGLSGASGAAEEEEWCQIEDKNRHKLHDNTIIMTVKAKHVTFSTYWELILQRQKGKRDWEMSVLVKRRIVRSSGSCCKTTPCYSYFSRSDFIVSIFNRRWSLQRP